MKPDKEELARVTKALDSGKMSLAEVEAEYPKAAMVVRYIFKHYPDDREAIGSHKMLPSLIFSDFSNTQIEELIDKLAIFNGWKKYEAINEH